MGSLFCSIDLCVCFCVVIMLFWLLQLPGTVWILGWWYLQLYSFFLRYICLFAVILCFHMIWILGLFWFSKKKSRRYFNRPCTKPVDSFGNVTILTILILPIQDYTISFHFFLFCFLLHFLNQCLIIFRV